MEISRNLLMYQLFLMHRAAGATSTGKFSDGSTTSSTLGLVGSTLKSAQVPSSPVLGNQTFLYWYNSTNSGKSQVFLTSVTVSGATTYYPQWTYPTLTISNQITGSTADKSKIFTYTIAVNNESGTAYSGKSFSSYRRNSRWRDRGYRSGEWNCKQQFKWRN